MEMGNPLTASSSERIWHSLLDGLNVVRTLKDKELVGCEQHDRLEMRHCIEGTVLGFKIFRK